MDSHSPDARKVCPPAVRDPGLGYLLHDVGKPPTFRPLAETGDRIRFDGHVDVGVRMAEAICQRLRFSNERHRADPCARRQSHAFHGRPAYARVNLEALYSPPTFR